MIETERDYYNRETTIIERDHYNRQRERDYYMEPLV